MGPQQPQRLMILTDTCLQASTGLVRSTLSIDAVTPVKTAN